MSLSVIPVAESYVGVKEKTGRNDGPEIKKFLAYIGLGEGNPYCAAFVLYCYNEAAIKLGIPTPLPKIGRVVVLWKTCQKNPYKFQTLKAQRVFQKIEKAETGDLIIWSHGDTAGNWNGHTGVLTQQIDYNTLRSIEANTGSGSAGSQRDGDGVYRRTRHLDIGKTFQVQGFIRVK